MGEGTPFCRKQKGFPLPYISPAGRRLDAGRDVSYTGKAPCGHFSCFCHDMPPEHAGASTLSKEDAIEMQDL